MKDVREWLQTKYSDKAEMFDVLYYKLLPAIGDVQLAEIFKDEIAEDAKTGEETY